MKDFIKNLRTDFSNGNAEIYGKVFVRTANSWGLKHFRRNERWNRGSNNVK
jgi:hypothetical protein